MTGTLSAIQRLNIMIMLKWIGFTPVLVTWGKNTNVKLSLSIGNVENEYHEKNHSLSY